MTTRVDSRADAFSAATGRGIFRDIVVGVDGSPEARTALQLAVRLRAAGAHLLGVSVAEVHHAFHTGIEAASWMSSIRTAADKVRAETIKELDGLPNVAVRAGDGHPAGVLLAAAAARESDLIAVGAGRHGRTAGLIFGSTATRIARESPCSVLIGHAGADPDVFPQRIIVGVDGSAHAADAEAVGRALADSFGAEIRRIAATRGEQFDPSRPVRAELDAREPVPALGDASRDADLLIVGSRGLRGLAALGSVAERVAHRAACPVLIVRVR
jgi:nucleotide-binding universal stress UspA family protein